MSTGLISDLLNIQPQTSTPAGSMQVKMLPCEYIMRNPDNKIYVVGDIDKLKEDIRLNGVRQPLEVIRWANGYKLIGGERRLTMRGTGQGGRYPLFFPALHHRGEQGRS